MEQVQSAPWWPPYWEVWFKSNCIGSGPLYMPATWGNHSQKGPVSTVPHYDDFHFCPNFLRVLTESPEGAVHLSGGVVSRGTTVMPPTFPLAASLGGRT
jgi:hypothetical protein